MSYHILYVQYRHNRKDIKYNTNDVKEKIWLKLHIIYVIVYKWSIARTLTQIIRFSFIKNIVGTLLYSNDEQNGPIKILINFVYVPRQEESLKRDTDESNVMSLKEFFIINTWYFIKGNINFGITHISPLTDIFRGVFSQVLKNIPLCWFSLIWKV